jgi:hypothetical protein
VKKGIATSNDIFFYINAEPHHQRHPEPVFYFLSEVVQQSLPGMETAIHYLFLFFQQNS